MQLLLLLSVHDVQVVLAGDPMQLGPVLRSSIAKDYGLQLSYLERVMDMDLYKRDESKFVNHGSYDPMLVCITLMVYSFRHYQRNS